MPSTWAASNTRRPLYATAPLITNISTTAARGRSDYNALQVSLRQRSMNGLEYLASYTLGRVRTNNLGYYGSGGVAAEGAYWMNTYEPEWNYGPAFFDARHNFVFSANYELPFGKGRTWGSDASPVVDAILGGWRLSGIFQARTGFPITVTDGANRSLAGSSAGNERPNCVGDPVPSDQSIARWLDYQCVPARPAGHVGQLRDRRRACAGVQEHRPRAGEAVQRGRRAGLRVPGGGVQPHEHAKLRSARAQHQRAEHVRLDHEHRQHGTDRGVGAEVLLLEPRVTRTTRFDVGAVREPPLRIGGVR